MVSKVIENIEMLKQVQHGKSRFACTYLEVTGITIKFPLTIKWRCHVT